MNNSNLLPAQTRYSFKWSRNVAEELLDSLGRERDLFVDTIGLSANQWAYVLAARPREWITLRNCAKFFRIFVAQQTKVAEKTPTIVKWCLEVSLKRAEKNAPDTLRGYLQERRSILSC